MTAWQAGAAGGGGGAHREERRRDRRVRGGGAAGRAACRLAGVLQLGARCEVLVRAFVFVERLLRVQVLRQLGLLPQQRLGLALRRLGQSL